MFGALRDPATPRRYTVRGRLTERLLVAVRGHLGLLGRLGELGQRWSKSGVALLASETAPERARSTG